MIHTWELAITEVLFPLIIGYQFRKWLSVVAAVVYCEWCNYEAVVNHWIVK